MFNSRAKAGTGAILVLCLVFATAYSIVSSFDLFVEPWAPRFNTPAAIAIRVPHNVRLTQTGEAVSHRDTHEPSRTVIGPGTVLDESLVSHKEALSYESLRRPPSTLSLGGSIVVYFVLSLTLSTYTLRLGQNRLRLLRSQVGVFLLVLLMLIVAKSMLLFTDLHEFWAPIAAIPLWIALAFDRRTALLINFAVAFLAASLLRFDVTFLAITLTRGGAGVLTLRDKSKSYSLVLTGLLSGIAAAFVNTALAFFLDGEFSLMRDIARLEGSSILACVGGGLLAGLLVTVLRDAVERLLGRVPRDRLMELTDIEHPLLLKLAAEAPGTWEHSRAMANLAEAAASAIGADALLTRVGAYFHDLGKTAQPTFFVENQGDAPSPHDGLPPEVSADAIMAHVLIGIKTLREGGIPEPVVEFAYTHHGTQLVEYFWNKYLRQNPDPTLTQDHFRYPGMRPETKETAILMLVDSIEAASRTVSPPSRDGFEEMIRRIVFAKLHAGQLDRSDLSMEDLHILTNRMANALVNMYHSRIKYPWQNQKDAKPAVSFTSPTYPTQSQRDTKPALTSPATTPPDSSPTTKPSATPPS